jgi:RNA-binding protein YlmH
MEDRNILSYTKFLNERQRSMVEMLLAGCGHPKHVFIPEYNVSMRTVLVFLPDYMESDQLYHEDICPISVIRATYSSAGGPSHRDFLGSLMGCGIKRETVGDILVGKNSCDIVIMKEILPFLLTNFESAGRVKLSVSVIQYDKMIIPKSDYKLIKDTVASLRLDSIVSSGFSISREKAASAINAGLVSLRHQECTKSDKAVAEGDVVSVRGMGKIELFEVGNKSRKGRIFISIKRYL